MNPAANLAPLPVTGDRSRAAFDKVILRLVKGGPERAAIAAGQVDAVMDAKTGKVILFPEARRALEERESQLHDLVELAADWIWQQDEHFRFAARSGAAVSESGLEDADVIGRTLWELPFDNMSAADWQTHRNQLEWRSSFRDLELRYVDRDDNLRYVSLNGAPVFDEQDHFRGYRGTATSRRASTPRPCCRQRIVTHVLRSMRSRSRSASSMPPGPCSWRTRRATGPRSKAAGSVLLRVWASTTSRCATTRLATSGLTPARSPTGSEMRSRATANTLRMSIPATHLVGGRGMC